MTEAQIVATYVQAGVPLATTLKEQGWTEEDLQEVAKDGDLLPMAPDDRKARAEALVLEHELGASKQTLLGELGYDPDKEAEQREEEDQAAGERMLAMMDRGQVGAGGTEAAAD